MKRAAMTFLACLTLAAALAAQDEAVTAAPAAPDAGSKLGFQAGLALGTDVITGADGLPQTWNKLGFQPDLSFGKFGIGLDLAVRFRLYPTPTEAIALYPGDWIPDYEGSGLSFLDLYLPKFMYVRYGQRGDPLFGKLGSIADLTLGNGFIVGEYANTLFLPGLRIFGLSIGLDGSLFDFPYVGIEALTGNLARMDVFGTRLFVKPLVGTELPILKNMQVGATAAYDRDPGMYEGLERAPVGVFGADVFVPIVSNRLFPLAAFTDLAIEPQSRLGWMLGAGGRLAGVISYGAQLRALGPGFIPAYFDSNYDLFRSDKAALMATAPAGDGFLGWFASLGTALFEDKFTLAAGLDGPFRAMPAVRTGNPAEYPHARAKVALGEGLLGGFFLDFSYEKYFLGAEAGFWQDLVDLNDAVLVASVNYKTGAAVFTLLYNLKYNPESESGFDITSSLQSSIKF